MNEELLSYFWKLQRFRKENLCTNDGEPIQVIYPGLLNKDAGPDFQGHAVAWLDLIESSPRETIGRAHQQAVVRRPSDAMAVLERDRRGRPVRRARPRSEGARAALERRRPPHGRRLAGGRDDRA